MAERRRRLLWHGMALFLAGLLTGLVEQQFTNPRMGLAAHLEGVMNGAFLLVVGAVWQEVRLARSAETLAFYALLYGSYANWVATTMAAAWGTVGMTPIASAGLAAPRWQEAIVTCGFVSVGVAMLTASGLILYGLKRRPVC